MQSVYSKALGGGVLLVEWLKPCGIVVSEFELQLRYYVHLQTNTPGKSMNLLSFQL